MIWRMLISLATMVTVATGAERPIVVPFGQEWNAELKPGQAAVLSLDLRGSGRRQTVAVTWASGDRSAPFFHAPCRIQIDSSVGQRLFDQELEIGVPHDAEQLMLHVQSYIFPGANPRQILVMQNASVGTGERMESRFLAWAPGEKAPRFFEGENQGLEQAPPYRYHHSRHDHLAISGAEAPWLEAVTERVDATGLPARSTPDIL